MHHDERGRAYYRPPKKNSNWPMFVIFGLFAVALVAFLVRDEDSTTLPTRRMEPPPEIGQQPSGPVCERLSIGATYALSRLTPGFSACGGGSGGTEGRSTMRKLRPASRIQIVSAKWVGKVRWYEVKVFVDLGRKAAGGGWVRSRDLRGQSLQRY